MQIRVLSIVIFVAILYGSCSEPASETAQPAKKDSAENQTFFPVTEYIRGQLSEIDSLPVTPLKIISYNGKQDSIWMKKEDIRPFAQPFLSPEIDTTNFKELFRERSFLDQTIDAFTFSYDPVDKLPDTLQLRRWDVYIDPKKNTIKRIYILKEINSNGTVQTIQLTWKSDQWCKISTIKEQPGKAPEIREETMKWDFRE
jgi:hypothetical protein